MALTKEDVDKYFEKSERMNLFQQRIKTFVIFMEQYFHKVGSKEFGGLNLNEKYERWYSLFKTATEQKEVRISVVDGAELVFHWHIDNQHNVHFTPSCAFSLWSGDTWYALNKDQLPGNLIEPTYHLLSQLPALIGRVYKNIPDEIEGEILRYLA